MKIRINVIHNPLNVLRRKVLSILLSDFDLEFVSAENCGIDVVSLYGPDNHVAAQERLSLWGGGPIRELSKGELYCTASHFCVWEETDCEWTIIIEDDAIPATDKMHAALCNILLSLPPETDIVYLGGGFPLESVAPVIAREELFTLVGHPSSNTCVAYMARSRLLKSLRRDLKSFHLPIDYEIAWLAYQRKLVVRHLNEYIFLEGSKFLYGSNLR